MASSSFGARRGRRFCCHASKGMYDDYYRRQIGGEYPVFSGARHQRGHGLGNVLGSFFRGVIPFFKRNIGTIGKTLAKTGIDIASGMLGGQKPREAFRENLPRGLKRTAENIDWKETHPVAKAIGRNLLTSTGDVVDDALGGVKIGDSLLSRGVQGIKRTARDATGQSGSGFPPYVSPLGRRRRSLVQSGRGISKRRRLSIGRKKIKKRKKVVRKKKKSKKRNRKTTGRRRRTRRGIDKRRRRKRSSIKRDIFG